MERWRGGLDVTLVFVGSLSFTNMNINTNVPHTTKIGLFSAIVTSFIVDSFKNLSQDEIARTNELLANLTEIVIKLSGTGSTSLNLVVAQPFVPQASDVRVNAYWSLSLVLSVCSNLSLPTSHPPLILI